MDLERLTCSSCGASLDVPPGVQFVNCRHCGSSLKVQRTESVAYTEVLEALQEHSSRLEEHTEILRLQGQLAQLDREWDKRSASLMVHSKNGRSHVPRKASSIIMGIVMSGFGLIWTVLVAGSGAPSPFAGFGVLFIGIAIATSIWTYTKAQMYETSQHEYEQRRSRLLAQLRVLGMDVEPMNELK